MAETKLLTALFPDRESAERAFRVVSDRGYAREDVSVAMSKDAHARHFSELEDETELSNMAAEGAGIGGAVGGTLGAIAAALAALGTTLALPGVGLVLAGPIAAALAGAGAGAATGGLVGALIGWGIPEERVIHYEKALNNGGILMGVKPRCEEDAEHFERSWLSHKGEHVLR